MNADKSSAGRMIGFVMVAIIAIAGLCVYKFDFAGSGLRGRNGGPIDPKNATYMIDGKPVALKDGLAEEPAAPGSASETVTRYFGNEASGDLDGDGKDDFAFILTQEGSGSGTFFYIAALVSGPGGYAGTDAILLGDRIAPQATEIRGGEIIANFADRKPGEPMTAIPSVGVSRYFSVRDGKLSEEKR